MQLSERRIGDGVIVDVSGKITLGDGGDQSLKDKSRSLVQQGHAKLLLNLGDVSYVDSAGLGEIVQSYATVNKNGGSLKLLHVTKRIQDLLSITKLLTVFETFDDEAEATASFSAPAQGVGMLQRVTRPAARSRPARPRVHSVLVQPPQPSAAATPRPRQHGHCR